VQVWEVASGRERWQFNKGKISHWSVACSPHGDLLALGDPQRRITLWDFAAGKEIKVIRGHVGPVISLVFSGCGDLLASSGGSDLSVAVWKTAAFRPAKGKKLLPLKSQEVDQLLTDLAGDDAAVAYRALRRLADAGVDEKWFAAKFHKYEQSYQKMSEQVATLIKDLDDKQFAIRDKASKALEKIGSDAEPLLRDALARPASSEVRQRLAMLLKHLGGPSREALFWLRVVELLEHSGTAESRHLLSTITKGPPWLAQEANESLNRLSRVTEVP
jgi:hypothetical protein